MFWNGLLTGSPADTDIKYGTCHILWPRKRMGI